MEEKSTRYHALELSEESTSWKHLPSRDPKAHKIPISDVAYQSQKNASIISLNSICKTDQNPEGQRNLQELSRELLLGISQITFREEKEITLSGISALQTTITGHMDQERVTLRTIVLQKLECVYDLMYIARPETFDENEPDFSRFAKSLQIQ